MVSLQPALGSVADFCRDQELRFPVHDSPDYYKVKCSVFNDDKKTDLIGETWIDLKDVIIPGGGQNDIWHQLQFKGKQAGEIRVEITFYDTRPQSEATLAKRKERREKQQLSINGSVSGGARQLGPRDIARRPLPVSPATSAPSTTPSTPDFTGAVSSLRTNSKSSLPTLHRHASTEPALSIDHPRRQQVQPDRLISLPQNYQPIQDPLPMMEYSSTEQPYDDYDRLHHDRSSLISPNLIDQSDMIYTPQPDSPMSFGHTAPLTAPQSFSSPHVQQRDHSSPIPYYSSPPQPSTNTSPLRALPSPTKPSSYRDSPLRQSTTQYDFPDTTFPPLSPEVSPPPPPSHRALPFQYNQGPSVQDECHTPWRTRSTEAEQPWRQTSWDERIPLQSIEQNHAGSRNWHLPHRHSESFAATPHSRPTKHFSDIDQHSAYRPSSGHENLPPNAIFGDTQMQSMVVEEPDSFLPPTRKSNAFRESWSHDGRYSTPSSVPKREPVYTSQPQLYRPRAISPNAQQTPRRKSLNSQPRPSSEGMFNSSSPFNPDSYEALNPVTRERPHRTSTEAAMDQREATRQGEVDKIRGQGPIIGNDGRVIDPSDHLPSDTWAPEPERKTRKPEHVIRIKTKDDQTRNSGDRPLPITNHDMRSSPISSSPVSAHQPPPHPRNGPNKLQKPMQNRPSPRIPVPHSFSSPNITTQPQHHSSPEPRRPNFPHQMHYSSPPVAVFSAEPPIGSGVGAGHTPRPAPRSPPFDIDQFADHATDSAFDVPSFDYSSIDIGPGRYGRRSQQRRF